MNRKLRIRVFSSPQGKALTIWSSEPNGASVKNGQLKFKPQHLKHFLSLLRQDSDSLKLLRDTIDLLEDIGTESKDQYVCSECGAPSEEPCEDDCVLHRARWIVDRIREILWRKRHQGLIVEE